MSNKRADAAKQRRLFRAKAKVTRSGAKAKTPSTTKVSSSARRGARIKASNAKVTSSGGKGSGTAKVTASGGGSARTGGGPNKADANRWKQANQSAKTSGRGPVKGAPGTLGAPTNAQPTARSARGQITANKMKRAATAAKAARAAAGKAVAATAVGKVGVKGAAAAAGINAGPVADGTLKGKATGPKKGPAANQPKNFDEAFKQARSRGVKEFTYKGKKYHTRRADGK